MLCFILEPRPSNDQSVFVRDGLPPELITSTLREGPKDGEAEKDLFKAISDFGSGPMYGWPTKPIDVGRNERTIDKVYQEIIQPVLESQDYRVVRSSDLVRPQYVTPSHLRYTDEADIVVVDLSMNDPIVMFCVGRRMAMRGEKHGIVALIDDSTENITEFGGPFASLIHYDLLPNETKEKKAARNELLAQSAIRARTEFAQAIARKAHDMGGSNAGGISWSAALGGSAYDRPDDAQASAPHREPSEKDEMVRMMMEAFAEEFFAKRRRQAPPEQPEDPVDDLRRAYFSD